MSAEARVIKSGSAVLGASTNTLVATFTPETDECYHLFLSGSAKTAPYDLNIMGTAPSGMDVHVVFRPRADGSVALRCRNGTEGVTLKWIIRGQQR